ncbi:MAG TPA: hypothetical protein VMF89_03540, partial [Polyangiales bacterium]|nr:hypothetical protein [Polyangiales bacterium]
MKEAQPIAEAGTHAADPAHALRANAATSGARDDRGDLARDEDAASPLAPEEADRFAMAFRPSWEPLAADQAAAPSTRPSIAPRGSSLPPPAPVHDPVQDELLRLRGRRARSRSIGLAAVSVLSFSALVYWGISTTTSGTERASTRGLQPPPPAAELAPAAEAPPVELARAPKVEQTG